MTHFDRRQLLRGAMALGGGAALGSVALPAAPADATALTPAPAAGAGAADPGAAGVAAATVPGGFPGYTYLGTPFDKSKLKYDPTGELIFPCIRGVYDKITGGLGRYYLYYAPHDAPGGIALAYGDSLSGQFTEYAGNPIVSNVWSPHYSVSHVSSPHVIWDSATKKFFLYFHGENTTTRMAWSTDGITFTYYGVVLDTSRIPNSTETSYARVFEYAVKGKTNTYVMLFMAVIGGSRKICWGWSGDGKSWTFDGTPLVSPGPDGQTDLSGPSLLTRNGTAYVVYHGNGGNMFLTEVGTDFSLENHLGVFHTPLTGAPDSGRSAAPSFGTDGGVSYMFYEAGQRLSATIAVARAD